MSPNTPKIVRCDHVELTVDPLLGIGHCGGCFSEFEGPELARLLVVRNDLLEEEIDRLKSLVVDLVSREMAMEEERIGWRR